MTAIYPGGDELDPVASPALAAHAADTTGVHGIADTGDLVVDDDARLTDPRVPTAHTHPQADVTGLVSDLAAKQPLDSDLSAIALLSTTSFGRAFLALVDAAGARTAIEAAAAVHTHAQTDITGLVAALAGKSATGHGHVIGDVTGLQAALDGLTDPAELAAAITAAVDAHAASDASDAELAAAIISEVANRDSAIAAAVASLTTDINGRQPLDSDLTAIATLTTTAFGRTLLTLADAAAAKGVLALVKGDVGLGNVDNTADTAKPVSTAQQTALDLKQNASTVAADSGVTAHLADGTDAHDASAISYNGGTGMSATDLEGAVDELATEKQNAATVAGDSGLTAHAADVVLDGGPHGFPALGSDGLGWLRVGGALVAVDLATQAELDTEKARILAVESGDLPIFDAKGDLLVAAGDGDGIRKPAGADGTFLRARAAATGGVEWMNPVVYGTIAARPGSGDFTGQRYYAYDDNGGTQYLWDGAAWIALDLAGREVKDGFAQITSNFAYSTDNTVQDVTGLTITFTPLQALVELRLAAWYVQQSVTASSPALSLTDSSNNAVATLSEALITGALFFSVGVMTARLTLTPGTPVTYKARIFRGLAGASTVTLGATATVPARIQAVYL